MVLNIFTKTPPSIDESIKKELDRVEEITKDKNLKKSPEKLRELGCKIWKEYKAWEKQTLPNRRNLTKLNEMLEGVVEETNFPFEGSSNITIGYASGMARTFKSTFNKTAYQDPDIFTAVTRDSALIEKLDDIEEAVNYSFHSECNGLDILKQGTIPCLRDGTLIISGFWDRQIEKCSDYKSYKTFIDFQNDFPNFASAGISEAEYAEIADEFIKSEDTEIICNFQYDNILYDGPAYEIVPLTRFVYYPTQSTRIRDMKLYGKEYFITKDKLKEGVERGEYYKESVEKLCDRKPSGENDFWSSSKNFIEKITRPTIEDEKPFKVVDAVWKADLDGDGIKEKYLVTFSSEHEGVVLSFRNYHIRNNIDFCVDFRLSAREDRFLGISLIGEGQDKFNLLDTIHRNRNNVRMLTTSPILLIQKNMKEDMDLFRAENIIKPGCAFFVDDVDKGIKQLPLQDLSRSNDNMDEENQIVRYLEFCLGPTQAMSGKETQQDPRAPMGKTIALLQQANGRIDDYLDEFRRSIPELAKLHCALLAQFGQDQVKYNIEQDGELTIKELDKKILFKNNIIWQAKRRSVTLSPEFGLQRIGGLLQTYAQLLPLIQQGDEKAIELWNRMVIVSGEPQKEKLMIQVQKLSPGQAPANNPIQQALQQAGGSGNNMPPLHQSTISQSPNSPLNKLNA
jgi:hypothetical protein